INWLFRHFRREDSGIGLTDEAIEAYITEVQGQLKSIAAETKLAEEPNLDFLRANLGFLLPTEAVAAVLGLIEKPPADPTGELAGWQAFRLKYEKAVSRAMDPTEAKGKLESAFTTGKRE